MTVEQDSGPERAAARLRLRNGAHGYGVVTKVLHWLTVAALLAQFVVGYRMDLDDPFEQADDRLDADEDRREEAAEGSGEAAEERVEADVERREDALDARKDDAAADVFGDVVSGRAFGDGLSLPEVHVVLGLVVIALALVRLGWRRTTPLPPWAEHLSQSERRLEGLLEKALLTLLLVVPATGLLLVVGSDGLLPVHVAAQIALLTAVALHLGLVLKHTVVRRNGHISRML